jgi:hypothetical protein
MGLQLYFSVRRSNLVIKLRDEVWLVQAKPALKRMDAKTDGLL